MNNLASGIVLTPEHWAQMETDINLRPAEEACGLVVGIGNYSKLVIPVTNILHDPHRFRMDPQEELNAFLLADQKGWEVLAIYHSHPHGIARPSITDHAELTFPGMIYLIWFQQYDAWQCRGYLMQSEGKGVEVPVIISTNK
jgi:proteasome lid subunit RPN8/RPN11